eukprot:g4957.t1
MAQVRVLPLRMYCMRRLTDKRPLISRACRPLRFPGIISNRLFISTGLRVSNLDHGLELTSDLNPVHTESLAYAFIHAIREAPTMEAELLQPLPTKVESPTDDPSLGNPLERLERMGTGWFGVILDFEGVVVQNAVSSHIQAWLKLAEEESKPRPLQSSLIRAAPMKAEQAISEVFCWGRAPHYVQKLARRKDQIFHELMKDVIPTARDGLYRYLETLKQHNIPVAVCSSESKRVFEAIENLELHDYIAEVVSSEDVGRCAPDPEAYAFAAQQLQRPTFRCVVIGASNHSCEAAHDCGMKYVAAAGSQPLYELKAADLVIKQLDEITVVNLKQLFRNEEFTEAAAVDESLDNNNATPESQTY